MHLLNCDTCTRAQGRAACLNMDGNLLLWCNTSSVRLQVRWIFQWPGGVVTFGVKLEGNQWTIMAFSLQNTLHAEVPSRLSASRRFQWKMNSCQTSLKPVGWLGSVAKNITQNMQIKMHPWRLNMTWNLCSNKVNTPQLFYSVGNSLGKYRSSHLYIYK